MKSFPNKKYQIIYADPPWPIKLMSRTVRPQQLVMPYNVLTANDIKYLPVEQIADTQCHLFLWTTHTWLPKAFEVMQAWGFKYNCMLTWDKTYGFTPFGFMWSTEFCLYGQRPGQWLRPKQMGIKTLITEKPTKHSRKPAQMRHLITRFCGNLPRIELFARNQKTIIEDKPYLLSLKGWDLWGNEC